MIGLGAVSNVNATIITFDNTANAGQYTVLGSNGTYTESGLTIQATGNTILYNMDANFYNYSNNGTDFGYFERGTQSVTLSATNPFSLQSFNAANIFGSQAGDVTVKGFQGGTTAALTQVFRTLGSDQWSLFSLTGWNNLTSVTITAQKDFLAFDNVTINAPTATPVPAAVWLFGSGLAGLVATRRKNKLAA